MLSMTHPGAMFLAEELSLEYGFYFDEETASTDHKSRRSLVVNSQES